MYAYKHARLQVWRVCSHSCWQNVFRTQVNVLQQQWQTCKCSKNDNKKVGAALLESTQIYLKCKTFLLQAWVRLAQTRPVPHASC